MPQHLSRRQIADYAADQIAHGKGDTRLFDEIAAYLIETKRTHQAAFIIRAIESRLAEAGIVVASVTTADGLDGDTKQRISEQLGAKELHIREHVDRSILGGVIIETPSKRFDASLATKINAFRRAKV